jgi:hypothetical protein
MTDRSLAISPNSAHELDRPSPVAKRDVRRQGAYEAWTKSTVADESHRPSNGRDDRGALLQRSPLHPGSPIDAESRLLRRQHAQQRVQILVLP